MCSAEGAGGWGGLITARSFDCCQRREDFCRVSSAFLGEANTSDSAHNGGGGFAGCISNWTKLNGKKGWSGRKVRAAALISVRIPHMLVREGSGKVAERQREQNASFRKRQQENAARCKRINRYAEALQNKITDVSISSGRRAGDNLGVENWAKCVSLPPERRRRLLGWWSELFVEEAPQITLGGDLNKTY